MSRTSKPEKKPIEQYDHKGKERVNNPPVGHVTHETDRERGKKGYACDLKKNQASSESFWLFGQPDARLEKIKDGTDEELIEAYRGNVSVPFEPGKNRRIDVKIMDDSGIESLKIMEV